MAKCKKCNGQGGLTCPQCKGKGRKDHLLGGGSQCQNCQGSGVVKCGVCKGKGYV